MDKRDSHQREDDGTDHGEPGDPAAFERAEEEALEAEELDELEQEAGITPPTPAGE